ncbi:hypothetical protein C8F04DRAFT_1391512 [Mycena alexandri]|uniref:Uncharacterized protein n=1 Tax=Mycena alexandri TaxID=1745969 RepID=A0AAD6XCW3_9AGAR|nr:hypothetical protein C8F04DRAFT_1391512 [Mycena alexandri]
MLSSRFGSSGIKAVNQPPWLWIPPPIWDTPGLAACLTSVLLRRPTPVPSTQIPGPLSVRTTFLRACPCRNSPKSSSSASSPTPSPPRPPPHPRAPWHRAPHPQDIHGRLAPLLVNRPFARIALPPFYHTLVLHSPSQARACLQTLRARPELARAVRVLVLASSAPGRAEAEVLALLTAAASTHPGPGLKSLDLTLPAPGSPSPSDALALAEAIHQLHALEVLTIRKAAGTYLSQPAPRAVLEACAAAVDACTELHTLTLTFPLAPDPALLPLVAALALAPALRTLACPMPAMWTGESLWLRVASNPALERICLDAQAAMPSSPPPRAGAAVHRAALPPPPPPYVPLPRRRASARAPLRAHPRRHAHPARRRVQRRRVARARGDRGECVRVERVRRGVGGERACEIPTPTRGADVYMYHHGVCPHAYTPIIAHRAHERTTAPLSLPAPLSSPRHRPDYSTTTTSPSAPKIPPPPSAPKTPPPPDLDSTALHEHEQEHDERTTNNEQRP